MSSRALNAATIAHLKEFEGLRLTAYPDPGSSNGEPWTIGYGHTSDSFLKVYKGLTISEAQAEAALVHDAGEAAEAVDAAVSVELTDNQRGALVSFVFNVGSTAFRGSTLLKRLNAGAYDEVPAQLARWVYNDGKVMAGLQRRRAAEAALWSAEAEPAARTVVAEEEPAAPLSIFAAILKFLKGLRA